MVAKRTIRSESVLSSVVHARLLPFGIAMKLRKKVSLNLPHRLCEFIPKVILVHHDRSLKISCLRRHRDLKVGLQRRQRGAKIILRYWNRMPVSHNLSIITFPGDFPGILK
jgi:hypothetical protein